MTQWARLQEIRKEDIQSMVEYLNELFLAGANYKLDYFGVSGRKVAKDLDLSENTIAYVSNYLSINEIWGGYLTYKTPAKFHSKRKKPKKEEA